MTPQETIKSIKLLKGLIIFGSPSLSKSVDEAISALELKQQLDDLGLTIEDVKAMKEKQTPKKVQKPRCYDCSKEGISRCVECDYYEYKCPNCKQSAEDETGFEAPNCPYCGQALDWSGDDD